MRSILLLLLLCLASLPRTVGAVEVNERHAFFAALGSLCGARFEGESVFPEDPGDAFRGKLLVAEFASCDDSQVRIPFAVGDDHSRTWVVTRTVEGVELKHDHRHADGTPDEITNYGGLSTTGGSALRQSFPADAFTAELIPEAATNVWTLILSADGGELVYDLTRYGAPRFRAVLRRVGGGGEQPESSGS